MFGYATPPPQKVALTNLAFINMVVELHDDEKGWVDTAEDVAAVAAFGATVYSLYVPTPAKVALAGALAPVLAPMAVPAAIGSSVVIAGGVASHIIDPDSGLDNYIDFYTEPSKLGGRIKFTAETVIRESKKAANKVTAGLNVLARTVENKIEQGAEMYLKKLRRTGIRV